MAKELEPYAPQLGILQLVERERRNIKERLDALEKLEADALAVIQEAMGQEEQAVYRKQPVVKWKKTSQKRLNQGLLKERYPDIHEECKTEISFRTFTVILPEDLED